MARAILIMLMALTALAGCSLWSLHQKELEAEARTQRDYAMAIERLKLEDERRRELENARIAADAERARLADEIAALEVETAALRKKISEESAAAAASEAEAAQREELKRQLVELDKEIEALKLILEGPSGALGGLGAPDPVDPPAPVAPPEPIAPAQQGAGG